MENNDVFVVTNVEYGWDCVCGVYSSFEKVKNFFLEVYENDTDENDENDDGEPISMFDQINNSTNADDLDNLLSDSSFVVHIKTIK